MRLLLWEVTSKSKIWYSNMTMFIKQNVGGLWKKSIEVVGCPKFYLICLSNVSCRDWQPGKDIFPPILNQQYQIRSVHEVTWHLFFAPSIFTTPQREEHFHETLHSMHKREYLWRKLQSSAKTGSKYRGIRIKAALHVSYV